ncbi:MAG: Hsp20/alpha crystallin family protein [Halomonas sp.]|jgi:HSP20 family protein|uniref:Hsp20/alpha crystallin family protein n=1 Tax=Billgrantia tianxiuensis TaxID=2497861 RepID=A0A6I6SDZ7_9GAMM|nr:MULTISPECIES: Hsp20/alpha crystallin family protein [Halomonas]MCE8035824.1 Hsp20/alpha crystallin family protein [Halomonas sp. MCCC 1A11057]MDX5434427.1 Hsp20/alpha crystallin family protein [Halomonas sp.]MDX5503965.1 Hsp20/alpha crystallin family protein [Halomonas sp.]QHC48679.1 Hsp20/alpha crystallin family protein [Halomonas tianxiuensis]
MFGDLKRFDTGVSPGADWFRQWLDELFSEEGAADIRSVPRGSFPLINVGRTDDAVRVYVLAAGLSNEDLEISVQDNVLTLRGRRDALPRDDDSDHKRPSFRRERFDGEFVRSIGLPDGIDVERAEARCRNGVFEIHLPKREELKPRRIEIQAA